MKKNFLLLTLFLVGCTMTDQKNASEHVLPPPSALEQMDGQLASLKIANINLSKDDKDRLRELVAAPVHYVTIEEKDSPHFSLLKKESRHFSFPLSQEEKDDILRLIAAYLAAPNCAGLAAPQIGLDRAAAIYAIPQEARKLRKDVEKEVPITLLLNAKYKPLTDETRTDWEGCFSVKSFVGEVNRPTHVRINAVNSIGKELIYEAKGYEARVAQHEIDHLYGIQFPDRMTSENRRGTLEEVRALRLKEMEQEKNKQ
jgi:peptide deformylase